MWQDSHPLERSAFVLHPEVLRIIQMWFRSWTMSTEACRSLDVVLFFWTSWRFLQVVGRPAAAGKFFSVVLWSPRSLEPVLWAFSDFVFHQLLGFCRSVLICSVRFCLRVFWTQQVLQQQPTAESPETSAWLSEKKRKRKENKRKERSYFLVSCRRRCRVFLGEQNKPPQTAERIKSIFNEKTIKMRYFIVSSFTAFPVHLAL